MSSYKSLAKDFSEPTEIEENNNFHKLPSQQEKFKYDYYIFIYMLIYENFSIIPFPFKELKTKIRKKHKLITVLNRVISEYFDDNKEGFRTILNYLDKQMNMPLYEINNKEAKEIEKEFKNFDASFGIIFDELNKMEWNEKKDIYIKYYSNIHDNLKIIINSLFKEYSKRNDLTNMNFLFYNYIKLFLNLIEESINLLENSNKTNINKNILTLNWTNLYFIMPLYNYTQDKIDEETMLNRISELGAIVTMNRHKVPRSVSELLSASKDTSIY